MLPTDDGVAPALTATFRLSRKASEGGAAASARLGRARKPGRAKSGYSVNW